jgi:hypothetical protein
MEELFTTSLKGSGPEGNFKVVFEDEHYRFYPLHNNKHQGSFAFTRQEDEWKEAGHVPTEFKQQAIEALENYLMKQH